jgi:RNA polymerase sigma factor (sigma-70 family)
MVSAILAGQAALFHELVNRHERVVYAVALSLLQNAMAAEEVAQEVFLTAFRNLRSFGNNVRFRVWVTGITLNEIRKRIQFTSFATIDTIDVASSPVEDNYPSSAALREWRAISLEAFHRGERRSLLRDAIAALPMTDRAVVTLLGIGHLSTGEAADLLQLSSSTLRLRLHRGRMTLLRRLSLESPTPKRTK